MASMQTPNPLFREGWVEADGFRIRYMEAGQGKPLIHLHGASGMRLTRGYDLLSREFRVIAFEMPGFGSSPENTRTKTMAELAGSMAAAARQLGINKFGLIGTSFGGKVALWLSVQEPERVEALVLEAPAAIRPVGSEPPSGSPQAMARGFYAHPERYDPLPEPDPAIQAKMRALVARLRGPDRDTDLENRLKGLAMPVLVLFGTLDCAIPPEMGRFYKQLLPNCHLVFVYDAGHAISTERPEAFAEVTVDFLNRHEAFVVNRAETVIHP
ncbi:MAG: alpha/beta fold hydrolase [Alphaproteobacteria bacterium]|nr:alpha/beta fold hydrolase [Alphaproteobacteria bacterium]